MTMNYRELDDENLDYVPVAEAQEVPNGEKLFLEIDDLEIILFNIAGRYFAIGNVCSHDGENLEDGELEGEEVICPRHGARFDVTNGKATALPAVEDIPSYPVRVDGEEILVGVPAAS